MYTGDVSCHSSTCEVAAAASYAFDYLSDGVAQGEWTLGSMQRRKIGDNLYSGTSIFNQLELFVRIEADPDRLMIFITLERMSLNYSHAMSSELYLVR